MPTIEKVWNTHLKFIFPRVIFGPSFGPHVTFGL